MDFWQLLELEMLRIERGVGDEAPAAGSPTKTSLLRDLIMTKFVP